MILSLTPAPSDAAASVLDPLPSVEVITFGCRLNAYESEVMREHARSQNLGKTVIINTCAVTNEAERQSRSTNTETI